MLRALVSFATLLSLAALPARAFAMEATLGQPPQDQPAQDQRQQQSGQDDAEGVDPRDYLYAQAPDLAPRLDCIIAGESGWNPASQNPRSRAAGLAQFLPSTWATTPEGQGGLSPFEPLANIDAAIWLARTKGWTQWQVYTVGFCH